MSEHHGSCHCGSIRLTLYETPPDAGECNCSICRRTGGLWHHCPPDKVTVTGEGAAYIQGDRTLTTWHCPTCGCTTHWVPIGDTDPNRMGVQMRLFEPALIAGVRIRRVDGAADTWAELAD